MDSTTHTNDPQPAAYTCFEYDGATGTTKVTKSKTPRRVLVQLDDGARMLLEDFIASEADSSGGNAMADNPQIVPRQQSD